MTRLECRLGRTLADEQVGVPRVPSDSLHLRSAVRESAQTEAAECRDRAGVVVPGRPGVGERQELARRVHGRPRAEVRQGHQRGHIRELVTSDQRLRPACGVRDRERGKRNGRRRARDPKQQHAGIRAQAGEDRIHERAGDRSPRGDRLHSGAGLEETIERLHAIRKAVEVRERDDVHLVATDHEGDALLSGSSELDNGLVVSKRLLHGRDVARRRPPGVVRRIGRPAPLAVVAFQNSQRSLRVVQAGAQIVPVRGRAARPQGRLELRDRRAQVRLPIAFSMDGFHGRSADVLLVQRLQEVLRSFELDGEKRFAAVSRGGMAAIEIEQDGDQRCKGGMRRVGKRRAQVDRRNAPADRGDSLDARAVPARGCQQVTACPCDVAEAGERDGHERADAVRPGDVEPSRVLRLRLRKAPGRQLLACKLEVRVRPADFLPCAGRACQPVPNVTFCAGAVTRLESHAGPRDQRLGGIPQKLDAVHQRHRGRIELDRRGASSLSFRHRTAASERVRFHVPRVHAAAQGEGALVIARGALDVPLREVPFSGVVERVPLPSLVAARVSGAEGGVEKGQRGRVVAALREALPDVERHLKQQRRRHRTPSAAARSISRWAASACRVASVNRP